MSQDRPAKPSRSPSPSGYGPADDPSIAPAPLAADSDDPDSSPHENDDHMNPSRPKRDPSKPKRKKARRACAACQRAHLTCSDERPCERCIKRNLAAACQDGARKKAKYLHDAPNEALMPGHAAKYKQENGTMVPADRPMSQGMQQQQQQQQQPQQQPQYTAQPLPQQTLPMQMQEDFKMQSPPSSAFESQQPSPMNQPPQALQHPTASPDALSQQPQPYPQQYMDPTDATSMFNFDIPSMNFGNHYGALEFGMLGNMGQAGQSPHQSAPFLYDSTQPFPNGAATAAGEYGMGATDASAWQNKPMPNSAFDSITSNFEPWRRNSQTTVPHAYAIGTGNNGFSGQSPASSIELYSADFATPSDVSTPAARQMQQQQQQMSANATRRRHSNPQPPPKAATQSLEPQGQTNQVMASMDMPNAAISKKLPKTLKTDPAFAKRRQRDPSSIYKNVTKPYPYTVAFHALTEVIGRRFPSRKRVRIAKALASIRPSFISLNRNLTDPDLVFMEQNFQRCIWDYEEDSNACGTPTLIIRRTGEVAYADKEFTLLSGWSKEVLYGRSPNLNMNKAARHGSGSGSNTAASSRGGFNTPRNGAVDLPTPNDDGAAALANDTPQQPTPKRRNQPVFLAELLDDDSIVDFYEEYSQRAFGDSRGTTSRRCKLLKYKAPPGADGGLGSDAAAGGRQNGFIEKGGGRRGSGDGRANGDIHRRGGARPGISSEEGMKRLGDEKGVVDCMYCWMVKQDCFNIPMLIVINILPIL